MSGWVPTARLHASVRELGTSGEENPDSQIALERFMLFHTCFPKFTTPKPSTLNRTCQKILGSSTKERRREQETGVQGQRFTKVGLNSWIRKQKVLDRSAKVYRSRFAV